MARTRTKSRRRWWWIGGAIVVVILLAIVVPLALGGPPGASATSKYLTAEVSRGTVTASVTASGEVVDEYTYSLTPGQPAELTERDGVSVGSSGAAASTGTASSTGGTSSYRTTGLSVAVGDRVKKNQVVATARNVSTAKAGLENALAEARQQLSSAYAALSADQSTYTAEKKSKTSTTQSVNNARKQVSQDYVAIAQARSAVASAQRDLDRHTVSVRSPITGVVRTVSTADNASASSVATIGGGDTLVSVMVSEYDIARVSVDQPVSLSIAATGGTGSAGEGSGDTSAGDTSGGDTSGGDIEGTVERIAEVPDNSSGVQEYQVVIGFTEVPKGTRIGMSVTAVIGIDTRSDVLRVPATALTTRGDTTTVQVLGEDGEPRVRTVTTGLIGDDAVEILTGLKVGDTVVTGAAGDVPGTDTGTPGVPLPPTGLGQ